MRKFLLAASALAAVALAPVSASAALFTIDYYSSYAEVPGVGVSVSGSAFFTETVDSVSFIDFNAAGAPAGRPNASGPFAAVITGTFSVTGATQNFHIGSDDGAYLFLNGALVGSNPGIHAYSTLNYTSSFAPGNYAFRVEYFNGPCCGAAVGVTFEGVEFVPVTPGVPEPSTWAMMLIGFAGLGYAGYRRRREVGATA